MAEEILLQTPPQEGHGPKKAVKAFQKMVDQAEMVC